MKTPKDITVVRTNNRTIKYQTILIIAVIIVLISIPMIFNLIKFTKIKFFLSEKPVIPVIVFVVYALFMLKVNKFTRKKQSIVRLEEGGIRPLWGPRRLFAAKGRRHFYPWVVPHLNTFQGACMELWDNHRSFIVGTRDIKSNEISMKIPPRQNIDCEVSREDFLQIGELFGVCPKDASSEKDHDLFLVTSNIGIMGFLKYLKPMFVFMGVLFISSMLLNFMGLTARINVMAIVSLVLVIGGLAFVLKYYMTPRGPARVLRISEQGLELRHPDGRVLKRALLSHVKTSTFWYRMSARFAGYTDYPVLRISFSDITLYLSTPYAQDTWSTTAKRCIILPPTYMLNSDDWNTLLAAFPNRNN